MTPDEMRRAAFLLGIWAAQVVPLKDADAADKARRQIREESEYLARLLREEAEAKELRQQYAAHGVPTPEECAAMQSPLPPPPQGREG